MLTLQEENILSPKLKLLGYLYKHVTRKVKQNNKFPAVGLTSKTKGNRAESSKGSRSMGWGYFSGGWWWDSGTSGVCLGGMITESSSVALYLWAGSTSVRVLSA